MLEETHRQYDLRNISFFDYLQKIASLTYLGNRKDSDQWLLLMRDTLERLLRNYQRNIQQPPSAFAEQLAKEDLWVLNYRLNLNSGEQYDRKKVDL